MNNGLASYLIRLESDDTDGTLTDLEWRLKTEDYFWVYQLSGINAVKTWLCSWPSGMWPWPWPGLGLGGCGLGLRVVALLTSLPFPHPCPLLFPLPLRLRHHKIQLGGLGKRCKLLQPRLGRSLSRNRIWCILAVKYGIMVTTNNSMNGRC